MRLLHRSPTAFYHRHRALIRRSAACTLAGTLLALLLFLGPWSLAVSIAVGGGLAAALGLAWRLGLRWRDRPAEALVLLTERMRAAGAGDFQSSVTEPLARLAPDAAATADWAVERLQGMVERAQGLAFNDPVTSLPNRLHVRREGEARLAALPDGQSAALMFIDLDRFKAVNDSLGHANGDMLLMRVAARLAEQVEFQTVRQPGRPAPVVGRLAGDEFTVLLPGADRAEALLFAQTTLAAVRRPIDVSGRAVHVSASFGIAMAPDHGVTFSRLMRSADDAIYAAKRAGRGRVVLFEDSMAATRLRAERMEAELRGALIGHEFTMAYQPQVQLATGRADVVEALIRWGPGGGDPVPAADFLAVAEDSGLIGPIGHWVANAVADRLGEWQRTGWSGRLAVNLSAQELAQPGALDHLELSVARAGGRLAGLEVEIGETAIGRAGLDVLDTLAALRAKGATVTIDGFGAGWSRLTGLGDLPVDRIKLDAKLIRDVTHCAGARTMTASCIGMIHGLGCQAIAAGVETAEQFATLSAMGADAVQGYHIARPMDEDALTAWSYREESAALAIAV